MNKSFTALGVSEVVAAKPGESFTHAVTGTFVGRVSLQESSSPTANWATVAGGVLDTAFSGRVKNETQGLRWYRFLAEDTDGSTAFSGTAVCALTSADDLIEEWRGKDGTVVLVLTDAGLQIPGTLTLTGNLNGQAPAGIMGLQSTETVITPGACALTVYHTKVVTAGAGAAADLTIGNGTGAVIGQRHLITLLTRTHASDTVVLDHANLGSAALTVSAAVLDAANEFILLEWQGTKWEIIKASAGVVTAA